MMVLDALEEIFSVIDDPELKKVAVEIEKVSYDASIKEAALKLLPLEKEERITQIEKCSDFISRGGHCLFKSTDVLARRLLGEFFIEHIDLVSAEAFRLGNKRFDHEARAEIENEIVVLSS